MAQDIIVRTLCDVCLAETDAHTDAKPYQVATGGVLGDIDLCDVHAKPLADLASHARPVKGSRKRKTTTPAAAAGESTSPAAMLVCDAPDCGRPFPTAQGLAMHRYRAHGIRSETASAQRARERSAETAPAPA